MGETRSRPSTATRSGWSFPSVMRGRARSGCGDWSSRLGTSGGSGKFGATTRMPIPGGRSGTPIRRRRTPTQNPEAGRQLGSVRGRRYIAPVHVERSEDMSYSPDAPPPPDRAPQARPGVVTAAAVLLLVGGGLSILTGILLLSGAGVAAGRGVGGLFVLVGLITLAVGALEVYAGIKVLDLRESGRMLGIVLAAIAGFLNLLSLGRAAGGSVIGLAINAFILYALITNAQYFRP